MKESGIPLIWCCKLSRIIYCICHVTAQHDRGLRPQHCLFAATTDIAPRSSDAQVIRSCGKLIELSRCRQQILTLLLLLCLTWSSSSAASSVKVAGSARKHQHWQLQPRAWLLRRWCAACGYCLGRVCA